MEEIFDQVLCFGGDCADLQALMAYQDFKETLEPNGCSGMAPAVNQHCNKVVVDWNHGAVDWTLCSGDMVHHGIGMED